MVLKSNQSLIGYIRTLFVRFKLYSVRIELKLENNSYFQMFKSHGLNNSILSLVGKIRTEKKLDSNSNLETKVLYIVDNSIKSKIGDKMSHYNALKASKNRLITCLKRLIMYVKK